MALLDRIERRTRWFGVPNVALPIVVLQSFFWVVSASHPEALDRLMLQRSLLTSGDWWRAITFMFLPVEGNPLFLFFALYIFYIMSAALENLWGAWRYNLYLLIGWLATVGCIFIAPDGPVTNRFVFAAVFLGFAEMYPDFELLLFFFFPVKVKYLALVTWILLIIQFAAGDALMRLTIVAGVVNFFLFFTVDLIRRAKSGRRKMVKKMEKEAAKVEAINTCIVCGATEKSNPKLEFRYCPLCAGTPCYCMPHMEGHVHRGA